MKPSLKAVLEWLDERGWPHDPAELTDAQNEELREAMRICGRRTHKHLPCCNPPQPPVASCKFHGQNNPRGIAHPNFKHGRYSRYMPPALAPAFERAIEDPDLLALNVDIATVEARLDQLLQSVEGGEPGRMWADALSEWDGLWAATAREDGVDVAKHRARIDQLLRAGVNDFGVWVQIISTSETKRRLVESEARRRERMQEFIRAEDAAIHYRALALAVKAEVDDPAKLSAIADEFARIIGLANIPRTQTVDISP